MYERMLLIMKKKKRIKIIAGLFLILAMIFFVIVVLYSCVSLKSVELYNDSLTSDLLFYGCICSVIFFILHFFEL